MAQFPRKTTLIIWTPSGEERHIDLGKYELIGDESSHFTAYSKDADGDYSEYIKYTGTYLFIGTDGDTPRQPKLDLLPHGCTEKGEMKVDISDKEQIKRQIEALTERAARLKELLEKT